MSSSSFDAINKRPPHAAAATTDPFQTYSTAFTGTGTSAAACLTNAGGIPALGCWITWIADADCYVHFGPTAAGLAAATSTAWLLPANTPMEFFHQPQADDFFSVVQKTTAGTLKRYRSNS